MTSPAAPETVHEQTIECVVCHTFHRDHAAEVRAELDDALVARDGLDREIAGLRAELARVQGELEIVCIDRDEVVLESAAQIERLTQELEPLRIRQHRMDIQELRVLIDGYQGTCFPLNRTSLHGLFDEIERQAQEIAALRDLVRYAAHEAEWINDLVGNDCQCEPCDDDGEGCGKLPRDCSGTECAQNCQCTPCDSCRAADLVKALSEPPARPDAAPTEAQANG